MSRRRPKVNRSNRLRRVVSVWTVAALTTMVGAGCAGATLDLGPAAFAGPVVCDTGCKVAWERAQYWIVTHSMMKVQTATDVIVTTYNPSSGRYGFTATREPIAGGQYRITIAPSCYVGFSGCNPDREDLVAAFNYYVQTGRDVIAESGKRFNSIQ